MANLLNLLVMHKLTFYFCNINTSAYSTLTAWKVLEGKPIFHSAAFKLLLFP
jgi:hypothetical protein